jgi:hypothetical protein
MNWIRAGSLLVACLAVAALVFGSGGFSSAAVERSLSVAVVDDDRAYVGVDAVRHEADGTVTVTVTNRFVEPLTVERIVSDGRIERPPDGEATVPVGERRTYSFESDAVAGDSVRVRATAEGFEATVTATVTDGGSESTTSTDGESESTASTDDG